ncbi:MAG: nucleoside transporter C-terminal domain-containing protein [Nitrospirota bacterium]|nr:nucleoside transporter C-terminal domain-containing protein [Nitrospirota bacterium]
MGKYNLVSFSGIFIMIGIAWLFSSDKRNMNWKVIIWGLILQMLVALFIFVVPAGAKVFIFVNDFVVKILDAATAGSRFVFGRLALPPGTANEAGETSLGFFLAFQALPSIIFFSSLMSILYFFNIMPRIIRGFAFIFTGLMKISGAESLVAASNIFVGIESALTIRPHLNKMTRSELCTVLSVGMATVASNVLAVYVFSLKSQFPGIAGHLVSASLLSAPAALLMSKVILPESEQPETLGKAVHPDYVKENNLFEAIINGANTGVKVLVGIVALLMAVLGLVAVADMFLAVIGGQVNSVYGFNIDWTLKGIMGYLFYPLTLILGVPPSDAGIISKIIGEKIIVTEVVAYQDLALVMEQNLLQHPRSALIAAYALCGFTHLASMAIFVGGLTALAPERTRVISGVAIRALIAATLACLMTACVAGTFFTNKSVLFGP